MAFDNAFDKLVENLNALKSKVESQDARIESLEA